CTSRTPGPWTSNPLVLQPSSPMDLKSSSFLLLQPSGPMDLQPSGPLLLWSSATPALWTSNSPAFWTCRPPALQNSGLLYRPLACPIHLHLPYRVYTPPSLYTSSLPYRVYTPPSLYTSNLPYRVYTPPSLYTSSLVYTPSLYNSSLPYRILTGNTSGWLGCGCCTCCSPGAALWCCPCHCGHIPTPSAARAGNGAGGCVASGAGMEHRERVIPGAGMGLQRARAVWGVGR
uniref:Uncharacterized protein n=1 Tax=Amazona collaria TaxID=241587 RepID=A0A8B9F8Q5_9PSIT